MKNDAIQPAPASEETRNLADNQILAPLPPDMSNALNPI